MDRCDVDVLAQLASIAIGDIQNLRLVNKKFNAGAGLVAVALRPDKKVFARGHFLRLGQLFQNATSLDLRECTLLGKDDDGLVGLSTLFPHLRSLNLGKWGKLKTTGMENLVGLSQLESLTLTNCYGLETLPESIGQLSLLQHLVLFSCCKLKSL